MPAAAATKCIALLALSVGLPWSLCSVSFASTTHPRHALPSRAHAVNLSEEARALSPAARLSERARAARARPFRAARAPRARIVAAPLRARAGGDAGAASAARARGARFASLTRDLPAAAARAFFPATRAAQPGADALAELSSSLAEALPGGLRLGLGPRLGGWGAALGAWPRRARAGSAGAAGGGWASWRGGGGGGAFGLVGASASSVPPAHPTVAVDPPLLLYQNSPICVPAVSQIDVINTSERDELQVYAITADNVQFHPAMFKPQVLQPGARATIQVIFLPRVVGSVEGALTISTSAGDVSYPIRAHAVPNP